ncbi:MAG: phosphoenolpyruvate carboxylase [Arsenophonus endosymbiont of Ceratovacuna japonica]
MSKKYYSIYNNINMLGNLLCDIIKNDLGQDILDKVEFIRKLSKSSRSGNKEHREILLKTLQNLSNNELLPVAKAFNQFLNLVNVAEQYYNISPHGESISNPIILSNLFNYLKEKKITNEVIINIMNKLSIELVLTAHPTEITRRTLINKLVKINTCLVQLDHDDLMDYERNNIMRHLRQLIAQCWHTDEIRKNRPSPIDEAKWGFTVIKDSLWEGVTSFLRELNKQLEINLKINLPIDTNLIRFTSWIGGDRDGNPYVTANITRKVLLLNRFKAVEFFLNDINILVSELSMSEATPELLQLAGGSNIYEPYRHITKDLRKRLYNTLNYLDNCIKGKKILPPKEYIYDNKQLWIPLFTCYQSLITCGMSIIANGQLLDTLRRINCFGLYLVKIDIRQESSYHTDVISELLNYLKLGDYRSWSEKKKQNFLLTELNSKRPLYSKNWYPSAKTQEVLETFRVIADSPTDSIAAYIISMTKVPSDILVVKLLLKECGCSLKLPIVPLFETLDDLNNAESVMQELLNISWYREIIDNKQMIMIGYSDSAKDAGVMASSWAQYCAQEALIKLFYKKKIKLTLFHGRGGTVGRGGAPEHLALFSQPPGSLKGGLRATEQGEMIRFKYGLPQITINSLFIYISEMLKANLLPPPEPKPEWRSIMKIISNISYDKYHNYIYHKLDFISYFRSATPELELSKLPLSSRPINRCKNGGVETLRAIPWIFAWTQNRLMLPSWLGAGEALQYVLNCGMKSIIDDMWNYWPFFKTRIIMLEKVFSKVNLWLSEYYDQRLVEKRLWPLGEKFRQQLKQDINTILFILKDKTLISDLSCVTKSIDLRNIYTDILNILQVELLYRSRQKKQPDYYIEQALMITIVGIAAGMRNTG